MGRKKLWVDIYEEKHYGLLFIEKERNIFSRYSYRKKFPADLHRERNF